MENKCKDYQEGNCFKCPHNMISRKYGRVKCNSYREKVTYSPLTYRQFIYKHNQVIQRYKDACGTIGHLRIEIADYQNYLTERKLDDDFRNWFHEGLKIKEEK